MTDAAEFGLSPAIDEMVAETLRDIGQTHADKPYHNLVHTLSVIRWSNSLAIHSGLHDEDRSLIVVAASFHDYVHGTGYGLDEAASIEHACRRMRASKVFGREAIRCVAHMVDGTVMEKVDGRLVQRAARGNLGARILADADLSTLGSPTAILIAATETLLREHHPDAEPRGPEMHDMLGVTLQLLENKPLTWAAQELLPHRSENHRQISILRQSIAVEPGVA